jgi:serine/threonine-protein kinase HipA
MNGELVGRWSAGPGGEELAYDEAWIASPVARPLSLSLPFMPGNRPHRGPVVRAYFENLLPESRPIRERVARRFKADSTDAFDLLAQIGRDCVGALQLMPAGQDPGNVRRISGRMLSSAEVARELTAAIAPAAPHATPDDDGALRISIAGAQEKTALLRHEGRWWLPTGATPTTHIFKFPLGLVGHLKLNMQDSVENEWLCMRLLRAYGLPVPDCEIARFGDQVALIVERFDRRYAPGGRWLLRLPQEDMCQATATPAARKYESDGGPGIDRILELLSGSANREEDRRNFLKAQILFWLLCATDGHAKNFSISIDAGGTFRMTPFYDVLSAYPVLGDGGSRVSAHKVKLAMAVRSDNAHWRVRDIQRRHWAAVARRHGMSDALRDIENEVIDKTAAVVDGARSALTRDFPGYVADSILGGLQTAVDRYAQMPDEL